MAEELGEVLREGLIPRGGDGAHQRHEDHVEGHVDDDAEGRALPQLDLGESLGQDAVDDGEADGEGEVDDEGHPRQAIVAVEGVAQVRDALGHAQLLKELLRGVGRVALGGARGQGHLPPELHDGGNDASEDACECCNAVTAALGICLDQCHAISMR